MIKTDKTDYRYIPKNDAFRSISQHLPASGMREHRPPLCLPPSLQQPVDLSAEDAAALTAARQEYEDLAGEHEGDKEWPPEVAERFAELEAKIERLEDKQSGYDPVEVARAGTALHIRHRIERENVG